MPAIQSAATTEKNSAREPVLVITPKPPPGQLQELWRWRGLILSVVNRNVRLRYKGSIVGIFWSMVAPIIQVLTLTLVIGYVLGAGPRNLSAYMLCAFLPWTFFNTSLLDGAFSVLGFLDNMKKAYVPPEVFPIASVVTNFIHFGASVVVFLIYRYLVTSFIFGWPGLPPREILWLPVVLYDMVALTLGLAFLVAAWTTFFEDVKFATQAVLQVFFYMLPIMYFAENIFYSAHGTLTKRSLIYHIYLLNPMAWIVTAFKQMFFSVQVIGMKGLTPIYSAPFDWRYCMITTATSTIVLVIGYLTFNRLKWKFLERA